MIIKASSLTGALNNRILCERQNEQKGNAACATLGCIIDIIPCALDLLGENITPYDTETFFKTPFNLKLYAHWMLMEFKADHRGFGVFCSSDFADSGQTLFENI